MGKKEVKKAEEKVAELLSETVDHELDKIPKCSITREELYAMERADRRERRKRLLRYIGAAVAVLMVFAAVILASWSAFFPPSTAVKDKTEVEKQKDDTVVIQEESANWEDGGNKYHTDNWGDVKRYKKKHPELFVPEHIPEGYQFVELTCEGLREKDFLSELLFMNKEGVSFRITQRKSEKEAIKVIEQCDKVIHVKGEKVYIEEGQKAMIANLIRKDQIIALTGNKGFPKREMEKVIKGLQ